MAGGLNSLASDNAFTRQAVALEARIAAMFPPAKFDFAYLPAALTPQTWAQALRRWPAVALQFMGVTVDAASGVTAKISAEWRVFLLTQHPGGARLRLLGDAMGPGLAGMAALAILALHGLRVPDCGAATVSQLDALGAEWLDQNVAAAGLSVQFGPFELVDTDAAAGLGEFLLHGPVWGFPDLDPALSPAPFPVRTA